MKKLIAVFCTVGLVACGGGQQTISGPTSQPEETTPVAGTVGAPQTVVPPAAVDGFDVNFSTFASFSVKNTGTSTRAVYAYITSFDNQSLALDSRTTTVKGGNTFSGSFNATCVQLDLSTEAVGGRPDIGFAYFDKQGKEISNANREEKIAECRRGTPTPEPSPTTTPQCEPSFSYRSVETTIASEYGACSIIEGLSQKVRTKTLTTTRYTTNSCTQQETAGEPSITVTNEYARCEVGFCHVSSNGTPDSANDLTDEDIQVQVKSYQYPEGNPGHNGHTDPLNQCPQDFWITAEKPCTGATAQAEILGVQSYVQGNKTKYRFTCSIPTVQ